jgi:hypothetical protein
MKIKFAGYWNSDYNIYRFINDIWNHDGSYSDVLTHQDDYTHLVIMNYVHNPSYRIEKDKTYGIVIEPYWSENFDKNMLSYCKKIVTYETNKYENGRTIWSPLLGTHRLYDANPDGSGEIQPSSETTKKILTSQFNKTKTLSIIVSNAPVDNRSYTNYNKRRELVTKLLNSDIEFDMYGRGWNLSDKRYRGPLMNKISGLSEYKYSICLENSCVSGNISEKFIDAILCNTIPIYNGHRDIEKFYPNAFEYIEYDGREIDRIKDIINSQKRLEDYSINHAKDLYLNSYNPIKIIMQDIMS